MVNSTFELPRDDDGNPINPGDVVRDRYGKERKMVGVRWTRDGMSWLCSIDGILYGRIGGEIVRKAADRHEREMGEA